MNCLLTLSNREARYSPGASIEGKVTCILTGNKYMEGISVKLSGKENTEWTENILHNDMLRDRCIQNRLYGYNKIIEKEQVLRNAGRIIPGTFDYFFTMELPKNLPSSFKGNYGQIRYNLKAIIKFSESKRYQDTKKIVIQGPVDLNDIPYAFSRVHTKYSDEKQVENLCCGGSGLATLDVYLDKEGYVIGEPIKVTAIVKNRTDENINHIRIELRRILMEKVTTPEIATKYDTQILSSENSDSVSAGDVKTFTFEMKVIDSIILHNLWDTKLFKEWFTLTVRAGLDIDNEGLMVEVRLVIGNISFTSCRSQSISVSHMNVPGGTPYPPPREEVRVQTLNHMMVPGQTPYPPTVYQISTPSSSSEPLNSHTENQERVSRRRIRNVMPENEPPPSYHDAIGNPNMFPAPRPS